MLPLTFCLSSIFMAKYCSVPLCFTSMTLPNEPVPRVFNLSKSSRHVVLCENNNQLASVCGHNYQKYFYSFLPVLGIPISVGNLLWLWPETLSLKKKDQRQTQLEFSSCLDYWHKNTLWFQIKLAKRPSAIIPGGERKKCG